VTIKVVPLPCEHGGVKFDLILPTGHVTTLEMEAYELRSYRASIADVIAVRVKQWLADNDQPDDDFSIIFL
jgi:hypothetical protein